MYTHMHMRIHIHILSKYTESVRAYIYMAAYATQTC